MEQVSSQSVRSCSRLTRDSLTAAIMTRCRRHSRADSGFTLIELMIVVAIIAVLAAIAYSSYVRYITKAHRVAAESCLSDYANYMERYYTTNLRYDQDTQSTPVANTLPDLDCKAQTSDYYSYAFAKDSLTATTYEIDATPQGSQKSRDTTCGTLSIDQSGKRGAASSGCW